MIMTIIEQRANEAIFSINRKMRDANQIDWEQRRYEIAKDIMSAFMSNSCSNVYAGSPENQAKDAVGYADALIAELKKTSSAI